jgi:hypothetical protein
VSYFYPGPFYYPLLSSCDLLYHQYNQQGEELKDRRSAIGKICNLERWGPGTAEGHITTSEQFVGLQSKELWVEDQKCDPSSIRLQINDA